MNLTTPPQLLWLLVVRQNILGDAVLRPLQLLCPGATVPSVPLVTPLPNLMGDKYMQHRHMKQFI